MRNDNIARSLRYYRNVNHKSIDDIIAFLREHDYDVSEKTIYAWEMVLTSLAQISSCSYANITR